MSNANQLNVNIVKDSENIEIAKKWYQKVPNAYVILFVIIVAVSLLTYIIPSGEFDRVMMPNGRMGVVPDSFHYIEKSVETKVNLWDLFMAIPQGLKESASIVFVVLLAGGMFGILTKTGTIDNAIGIIIANIEKKNIPKRWIVVLATLFFGFCGAVIGYESLFAFVPVGVMIAIALGYDLMTGAAIAVGGLTIGFGTSPIGIYTVGVAQEIAELPMFSGIGLRTMYCVTCLLLLSFHNYRYVRKIEKDPSKSFVKGISTEGFGVVNSDSNYKLENYQKKIVIAFAVYLCTIIIGVVKLSWGIAQISTLFIVFSLVFAILAKMDSDTYISTFMKGAGTGMSGALIIGFARTIAVILSTGKIADTIIHNLSRPLTYLPPSLSAIGMTIVQGIINFFIPSGSGQAMATMPIMIPLSDIIGVNRQIAILAFQVGDGLINMVVPTLGILLAMIAVARVPYNKWIKYVSGLVIQLYAVGWIYILIAVKINWS